MSKRTQRAAQRPGRGRPRPSTTAERRRAAGPTLARLIAVRVLERVPRVRAYADIALHHALARSPLAGSDRALATELVYGTLRWRGRIDYLLAHLLDRPLEELEPLVASILRLGAYQILFLDRIPASAAVDQSVRCARAVGAERATGLVNAVLRRVDREHASVRFPELDSDPLGHLTHALSMPEWIAKSWLQRFGASEAAELVRACNEAPPLAIRVNRRAADPEALLEELRRRFPDARRSRIAPDGIVLGRRGDPGRDPAFLSGQYTVQDEASQLVVTLLDPQPGERLLDVCAAPGTKTTAMAERIGDTGSVLALDRHSRRLGLVARAARRLGLECISTLERDATRPLGDLPSDPGSSGEGAPLFDRVLVDAPCSGLGSLRRNPDARWRVRAEDPRELATLQLGLLERASEVVRSGGTLVYSTCTLLSEENEDVVSAFLRAKRGYRLVPRGALPQGLPAVFSEEGYMSCLPHRHDTDGFFAARLERVS